MTDDQIIEMAKRLGWNVEHAQTNRMLVLFAKEVAAVEREECAVICDYLQELPGGGVPEDCAMMIRERGQA